MIGSLHTKRKLRNLLSEKTGNKLLVAKTMTDQKT